MLSAIAVVFIHMHLLKTVSDLWAAMTFLDSVPSHYRINAFFPFVDHCLSELNERFPEQTRPSFLAFQLLPWVSRKFFFKIAVVFIHMHLLKTVSDLWAAMTFLQFWASTKAFPGTHRILSSEAQGLGVV
jgi:hypothetical protein